MNDVKESIKFFKKKYGHNGIVKLKKLLKENASGQEIADTFGVTRQRAFQWKKDFTEVEVRIKLHRDLEKI